MSKLYIVATPIGNLADITYRAISVLNEVDIILSEDTRVASKLLSHYEIKKKVESFHAHTKDSKVDKILSYLESGKNIALITDAGTPGVSDPGATLVKRVLESKIENIFIIPIPGASALTTAISASGIEMSSFNFLGFLPHKKGRETLFKKINENDKIFIFYESPHRVLKTLEGLEKFLDSNREVVVAKELTKIHEEFVRGDIKKVREYFLSNPSKIRGEFVVIIGNKK